MNLLRSILDIAGGSLMGEIGKAVDEFTLSADEKQALTRRLQEIASANLAQTEETLRTEISARERVMVAELQHGDTYTQRARPTIVYGGLVMIAINYVLYPIIGDLLGTRPAPLELPLEFWAAWGSVPGIYALGRSAEKRGASNALTELATGRPRLPGGSGSRILGVDP